VSVRLAAQCRCVPVNSNVRSHVEAAAVLRQLCGLLDAEDTAAAVDLLRTHYPVPLPQTARRAWPPARAMAIFLRDGFTDRYSGAPLVFPGTLRAISLLLPKDFPYQRNWRQSETHAAFWELYPTIDHVVPLARGGTDDPSNVVTTSMVRNAAKANWTLEELGWPVSLAPPVKDWDGLLPWFLVAFQKFQTLRDDPSTRTWHNVATHAT